MSTLPARGSSSAVTFQRRTKVAFVALLAALGAVASLALAQQAGAAERTTGTASVRSASGQTCIVGKGLVTRGSARRGSRGTAGRVLVKGPGGTWFAGAYRCRSRTSWTVTVDGGSGTIGGVALSPAAFTGTISSARGVITSSVSVGMGSHPRPVPQWNQNAVLHVYYAASALRGNVWLSTSLPGNSIGMVGPLESNGSYRLAGSGVVAFAGSSIPLKGEYRSVGYAGAPRTTWSFNGVGPTGSINGVPVLSPTVAMTQDRPGVTGTAVLSLGAPETLPVNSRLSFVDSSNWTLTSTGSPTATWRPASIPGLSVDTAAIGGTVKSTSGSVKWSLSTGMSLVDEQLTMRGTFSFSGPQQWRIDVSSGAGSILGLDRDAGIRSVTGAVSFDRGVVTGSVRLTAGGELLVDLPAGWTPSTDLTVTFAKTAGGVIAVSKSVNYSMVNGDSRLVMSGTYASSSDFSLTVSGSVSLSGTAIPFGGVYQSAGFDNGDGPRPEPSFFMSGSVASVAGGKIPLDGGAAISGGTLGLSSEPSSAPAALRMAGPVTPSTQGFLREPGTPADAGDVGRFGAVQVALQPSQLMAASSSTTQTFSGQMDVQLSGNDSFSLAATVQYTDADNFLLTVNDTEGEAWSPFPGLTVPPQAFRGTVQAVNSNETWNVTVDGVEWSNLTTGVNLTTSFELSDQCPLTTNCTDAEGIYVGFTEGALDFPGDVPDMSLTGAFLTDGTWARFDATSADLVFDGIGVSDVELAMWKGERGDQYDERLEMPDLSEENNSFNIEFCGKFQAEVPDVATLNTGGCVEWAPDGVVMAQVGMGGDVDSGEANGVSIGNTTLTGYAWTDLTSEPTVGLDGAPVELVEDRHHLTAEMDIPADVMKAVGAGDDPATIDASGWFSTSGDFNLDAVIEVSMKSSGFTLEGISVHIGKDGSSFSLGLGADATVSVSGNHFPVTAFVGVEAGGGSSEIVVRLTAKGAVNEQKSGSFDVASLLPTGNFEPESPNTVDGSFDAKPDKNMLDDGDFEGSLDAKNLVPNPDFETGIQDNLLPSGDFESGTAGNLMPNNDLEDTDVLVNGDFEDGTTGSWTTDSNFSATVTGSAESPSTAPTTDQGVFSTTLKHTSSAATANNVGLSQRVKWAPVADATYNLSVWSRSPDSTSGKLSLAATQEGSGSGCTSTANNTFTVGSSWTKYTLTFTGKSCRTSFNLVIGAPDAGDSVMVDSATFQLTSSPTIVELPASVERPALLSRFDTLPPISKAADVSFDANTNALRSDGNGSWWYFNPDSYGVANGDFDVSMDVLFMNSSARDMASFGFWMNGSGSSATGFAFRSNSCCYSDGGFWQINGTSQYKVSNPSLAPLTRNVWHTIRLTAVGDSVTAVVTRLDTGAEVSRTTATMPAGNRTGSFGQVADGAGSGEGHRWDNFTSYSLTNSQRVRFDPANARSGNQYLAMSGTAPGWDAQFTTIEAPTQGSTYTYSAWVRSRGANVSGNLYIDTEEAGENASTPFTATGTWQRVSVTKKFTGDKNDSLRPGFVGMTGANVEVDVDDQTLQLSPWNSSSSRSSVATTTDAHSGTGALEFTDGNNGSSASYDLVGWPGVGTTYTATAWIKAPSTANVALRIAAVGGSVGAETQTTGITTSTGWTQYSVAIAPGANGHANLQVGVDVLSGSPGKTVLVDDVTVTAFGYTSDMDGSVSDAPSPSAWSGSGTNSGIKVESRSTSARAGSGHMQIVPPNGGTRSTSTTATMTPQVGSTYTATAWVWGGNVAGRVVLSSGLETAATPFTATGTWTQVTASLPITRSGATGLTMTIENNNTGGVGLEVDDVGIQLVGKVAGDPWYFLDNGLMSTQVASDAGAAHGGSNYFELKATNAPALAAVDSAFTPVAGTQYTQSVWVKSPTGQPVTAEIGLFSYGGTTGEQRSVTFTTSGSDWQQYFVTLPINQTSNTKLQNSIRLYTLGVPLQVDDVVKRAVSTWSPVQESGAVVNEMVVPDQSRAAEGSSYLTFTSSNNGRGGVIASQSAAVEAGTSYQLSAYVRSTRGNNLDGTLGLTFDGRSAENKNVSFTANSEWQLVEMDYTATKSNTVARPHVDIYSNSQLDVDSITLTPVVIAQADPWRTRSDINPQTYATVYYDQSRAHDGSLGVMQLSKNGSAQGELYHDIPEAAAAGSTYTANAWVRSSSGAPVTGSLAVYADGGAPELVSKDFTATGEWQVVTLRMPIRNAGHTSLRTTIAISTSGVTLDIDDVTVQQLSWQTFSDAGGTANQQIVTDGAGAQSGSGYLQLTNNGSAKGATYSDDPISVTAGTTKRLSAWVRSPTGQPVSGSLYAQTYGGQGTSDVNFVGFTVSGTGWKQVSVALPITNSSNTTLRQEIDTFTQGVPLDIDTVAFLDDGAEAPDGITTPLPHPESGYSYLWDDAFGIPGAHLWGMTAQIQFVNGKPGLGVGATIYMDPTKAPGVLVGTEWLKGDMALNISRAEPCFSFGFDAGDSGTAIQIKGGVFTTTRFQLNFATKGCEIGDYVVAAGATLAFDTSLGDSPVHFDLEIGLDPETGPTFYADVAINNLKLAGTLYKTMQLTVDVSADSADVTFVGDFSTSLGDFYGDFDFSVNGDRLHMAGLVSLSDWRLVGGTMDLSSFSYSVELDVGFESGACASFSSSVNGDMSMGGKSYVFNGNLRFECGTLKVLHLQFNYQHRSVSYLFALDYNSSTKVLAGGAAFNFERTTSWKFLGKKYKRHPKMAIALAFSMKVDNPSAASLTLGGTVSVSGGSGSIECSFGGSSDDECKLKAKINVFGGTSYSDTW